MSFTTATTTKPTHAFLEENTMMRCAVYMNHTDRKEFDCVVIRRRPGLEHQDGRYYICYYADIPNSDHLNIEQIHATARSRNILEADDVFTVLDYFEDMFDMLELDIAPFKKIDIDTVIYPSVIVKLSALSERRKLILRCIEDSLRSERITA